MSRHSYHFKPPAPNSLLTEPEERWRGVVSKLPHRRHSQPNQPVVLQIHYFRRWGRSNKNRWEIDRTLEGSSAKQRALFSLLQLMASVDDGEAHERAATEVLFVAVSARSQWWVAWFSFGLSGTQGSCRRQSAIKSTGPSKAGFY